MTNCIYDNKVICGDNNKRCQKCTVYFAKVATSPLSSLKPELIEKGRQCLIDNNVKNCDANTALALLIKIISDKHHITKDNIHKALRVLCEYGIEDDESFVVLQALCYILFDFEIDDEFENNEIANPTKVWLVTYEWCDDYDTNSSNPMIFSSLDKAKKQFCKIIDDEKHNGWIADIPPEHCNNDEYVICEDETQFEAYPAGCYQEKHILVTITAVVVDEVQK